MPNNDIDTVNILDFDAVHDLRDGGKDRKRAPPLGNAAGHGAGKPVIKRPAEKSKPTAEGQSPEKKMNQLRQQLNQKGFQIELASSVGSLVPEKRAKADNQIDTPDAELYGREADTRNPGKPTAAGQANPKGAQQANQRMQPDDYRNLQ